MREYSGYPSKAGIYKLIDSFGKVYIGKSVNIRVRLNAHKNYKHDCKSKSYLKNAILKYGWNSFTVEILELFENFDKLKDNQNLLIREAYYIELVDASNKEYGYNLCKFSTDRTGIPMSDQARDKLRKARLGTRMSEETKEKLRNGRVGKKFSEEHKRKLREARANNPMSEDHKEKLRKANVGKIMSDDTKEKLRQCNLGKVVSDETRKKLRNINLGRKHTEESIQKIRDSKSKKNK